MERRLIVLSCAILSSVLWIGCATRSEVVRFKEDVSYMKTQIDLLQTNDDRIMKEINDLDKSLMSLKNEINTMKADILSEVSTVKDKTLFLGTKLEDTSYRMNKLLDNVQETTANVAESDTSTMQSPTSTVQDGATGINRKQLYNSAYLDLTSGNYDLALQGFMEYLKRFPDGELANNSQYWIGEIYYAKKDYRHAIEEFRKVIANYSRGSKVPAALLKMGYCAVNLGDNETAKRHLNAIIQNFPNSEEVVLAKNKLAEIK